MNLPDGFDTDVVHQVEANLDDLTPELAAAAAARLLAAGALDAWLTPIQMKKGRPGFILSALCDDEHLPTITELFFAETSTFGVRIQQQTRLKLHRRFAQVDTAYGAITIKIGERRGKVISAVPEYDSCLQASQNHAAPVRVVYAAAAAACETFLQTA